ncbi:CDP-diacylglycerol--glycerol-3-phosphate 3-phosphatidyltransferase [Candidatus Saccharibacteria bacterium]|nr:CDP-diacylglycerol--glycerol-3-phosphate 3-phosphatidyltransferase [Candidatus Saccharibacteria bacterium]
MNLPNKLTVTRVALIPFFVFFALCSWDWGKWVAVIIFIVASLTDLADGKIARKRNLITNFGKLMDPLADKLLVSSALICLVELGRIPAWMVIIIIAREFIISGVRQIAVEQKIVIAASWWGKWKTTFQMIMVILMLVNVSQLWLVTTIVMWTAFALTVISMMDYLLKNYRVFGDLR